MITSTVTAAVVFLTLAAVITFGAAGMAIVLVTYRSSGDDRDTAPRGILDGMQSLPYRVWTASDMQSRCIDSACVEGINVDMSTSLSPQVTVIIPSYRRTAAVRVAIQSVRDQTYEADRLRIIVVDDCSPNRSDYDALERELIRDKQVRLVRLPYNGGQSNARNVAVQLAKESKYIAFLDDDDAFLPDKISVQVACMEAEHANFCSTDGISGKGAYSRPTKQERAKMALYLPKATYNTEGAVLHILRQRFGADGIPRHLKLRDILIHNVVITSSVCITRELFLRSVRGFDPEVSCAEDYKLWKELLGPTCNAKALYLSVPLFYYDSGHAGGSWWGRRSVK